MSFDKNKITIGVLAHVDAGKTTLTEGMLHTAGATRKRGSVDKGSAITDGLEMEKERGISIKTATVDFEWNSTLVTLVDTPGHIDFSAEVDRALSVLDIVVLVVSAVEGVQANTINLWESLNERKIPTLIFINKIDRDGADIEQVYLDLETDLRIQLFALNYADTSIPKQPSLISFTELDAHMSQKIIEKSFENLTEFDEDFFEDFLNDTLPDLLSIKQKGISQIQKQHLIPLLFGSGKLDMGIDSLLDAITSLFEINKIETASNSAKVFKVEYNAKHGRLAHIKLYSGYLKNKDTIWSQQLQKEIKINQILKRRLDSFESVGELLPREIGVITTSDVVLAGDVLGNTSFDDQYTKITQPVLSVQAIANNDKDYQKLGEALELLNIEDPQLDFKWYKEDREFHLRILGPIQTEVLKDSLLLRFNISAHFLKPKVIYKETPKKTAEGYVRYWMPKPCWAIMTFLIEPGAKNSGVQFDSKVRTSDISLKYQNEVKRAIPWSLRQGIKGWEVTDIKITLIEGSEHTIHSNPGDFLLATPMGILRGLEIADTELLEPMYAFEIKAHQDTLGAVSGDLSQMNAQINSPEFTGDNFSLTGRVAVEKAMDYGIKFSATTSGKGRIKLVLDGYDKTIVTEDKIKSYKGVSPLDESQWILHKRGAFKADDRVNW